MENKKRIEFDRVKPFDIIWAIRDKEESEIFGEEKCYEGSYIVVGRTKEKLYCLRSTQKFKDYYNDYIVYSRLTKNKYNQEKMIFYLNIDVKTITYDEFLNIKTRLNLGEIKDFVSELKKQEEIKDKNLYDIDLYISVGDIINNNGLYYLVIYKYKDKMHCIPIEDDRNLKDAFYIYKLKNINYDETKVIDIDENVEFINRVSTSFLKDIQYVYINKNYELVQYLTKKRNMKQGLIIELNDKLYYVNEVLEDDLSCFEIVENTIEPIYDIKINDKIYNCKLNNNKIIDIKENFRCIFMASEDEIIYIKSLLEENKKIKLLIK